MNLIFQPLSIWHSHALIILYKGVGEWHLGLEDESFFLIMQYAHSAPLAQQILVSADMALMACIVAILKTYLNTHILYP